jgi:predicted nucleic acid-binding protein
MILVDTAIWIDHLDATEPRLVDLLAVDQVGCHDLVVEEMALGSIAQRDVLLDLLANLYQFPVIDHREVLHLTNERRLWGRGLSAVDVHLMAAVAMVGGAQLWTRDRRLQSACADTKVQLFDG